MLIQMYVLKVINNQRKMLTHNGIIARMSGKIDSKRSFTAIKTTAKYKNLSQIYLTGRF